MTIANRGKPRRFSNRRAQKAKSIEMHQATMTADGVMQMRKVKGGLPIDPGASLVFEPGGTHLMLLGLEDALNAGEQLLLTLEFDRAGQSMCWCRSAPSDRRRPQSAQRELSSLVRPFIIGETAEMQHARLCLDQALALHAERGNLAERLGEARGQRFSDTNSTGSGAPR